MPAPTSTAILRNGETRLPSMQSEFSAVVFSGGGCRCFWQAGFWATAAPQLELKPKAIAAVSAGAAFACAAFGGATDAVLASFIRRTRDNPRNFYPGNVIRRKAVFPHEPMYRGTILETMDAAVLERLRTAPEIRVLMTRPPRHVHSIPALAMGFAAYGIDRLVRRRVHPTAARSLGFQPMVVTVQSCKTPAELADLIMHSSCMPPLTPAYRRDGRAVIDGALLDAAPADLVDEFDRTLVLLSRRYEELPEHPARLYVQPSEDPPIKMWDYANPDLIQAAYDLGRRDGDTFAAERLAAH